MFPAEPHPHPATSPGARHSSSTPDGASHPDGRLILLAQRGDQRALDELFRRYNPPLTRWLTARVQRSDVAEDLAAEAWGRVLQALPRYRPRSTGFAAWLYRIGGNVATDWQRRQGRMVPAPYEMLQDEPDPHPTPEETVLAGERETALAAALDELRSVHPTWWEAVRSGLVGEEGPRTALQRKHGSGVGSGCGGGWRRGGRNCSVSPGVMSERSRRLLKARGDTEVTPEVPNGECVGRLAGVHGDQDQAGPSERIGVRPTAFMVSTGMTPLISSIAPGAFCRSGRTPTPSNCVP